MKVLITGDQGLVGREVRAAVGSRGWEAIGFDLADGCDVRDAEAVAGAARGCEAIVHLAARLHGAPDDAIFSTNVLGTWNVLHAAESVGASRVIFCSSVNALGIFIGEAPPDYLPIDDDHPCRPGRAYGMSKLLGESMCEAFTARTGVPTICLRPPAIWDDSIMESIRKKREQDPEFEWTPYWEYGCFLHVRDLAEAITAALEHPGAGHVRLLVNAADISSAGGTSRELARAIHPGVPWRGGAEYDAEPYRALIDSGPARARLGWTPAVRWRPERAS
jgi:UDP-glucose 4-epimerase